ncbi:MAG: selenocysteine-specific translation elongation factor [Acidobacteriota bacterium]|jgi:selenocysteine-specific elongation factor|nr:selenocysteine-specific translation elongation factor [Acidobacteriota bacterium]
MRHVIVGTAGHIDHGKSALIRAMTGVDPDRLKEEQARGITIDLGFAHLDLGDVQVGFVDVPGHEKFVKNMLAGVGGIDFVLLVVAADESIMPQTREHFDICRLLGVASGIVVVTKTDMVDGEMLELVVDEVRDTVKGSFLENADVIPVSSKTGDGIDRLKAAIHDLSAKMRQRPANRLLRLPIDRAFSIRGFGTVLTGTLTSGEVQKDQEVELVPGGLTAKVRGIQVHGEMTGRATSGQRTAVNLQGVDLAAVERGMVLTVPRTFRATQILDVRLSLLPDAKPLRHLVKVRFHQGTKETLARVALIGRDILAPGETAYAQLRLDEPVFCLHGDAFIIRRFSPTVTIGGGVILHPNPSKHKSTDREALDALRELDQDDLARKIPVLLAVDVKRAIDLKELNSLLGLPVAELTRICTELAKAGKLVLLPAAAPVLILPEVVAALEKSTLALVTAFHKKNPLLKGVSKEELRKRFYDGLPLEVFRHCLDGLAEKRRIMFLDEAVSLYGRDASLSPEEEKTRKLIEEAVRESGYQPPTLAELQGALAAKPEEVKRIFFWMIKERQLVKVAEDLVYLRTTLDDIKAQLKVRFPSGSKLGVPDFKELFGITRKHAIPLLEFMDREKFTRRLGADRVVL